MDPKLLNFFATNEKTTHDLYTKILSLIDELKKKGKEAQKLIDPIKAPAISDFIGKDDSASDSRADCAYCVWCEGDLGNGKKVGIELQIRASGWRILLWPARETDEATVEKFVKTSGIKVTPLYESMTKIWEHDKFPYEENPYSVALKFKEFVLIASQKLSEFKT